MAVLYSKGHFCLPLSHSPEHHLGAPGQNLLPEDPKLNSSCGFRAYQNDVSICIIPFEISTLQSEHELCLCNPVPSDPTETLFFSLYHLSLEGNHFYIGEERLPRAIASPRMWAPLMAGFQR